MILETRFQIPQVLKTIWQNQSRYREESFEEAAEALRRKLAVKDLAPTNRWYYLSAVTYNIEKEKKEEENHHALDK